MLDLTTRLGLLADAARHDAPCAARTGAWRGSHPTSHRGRVAGRVLPMAGAADPAADAICHAVAADGRTVALLKILLSNHCVHDCAYCPLRRSADGERARLTVREVVRITLDYHRRGLVEGLFLSAAVDRSADATMEQLVAVARSLREEHHFLGYVHLKVIPEASSELIVAAGRWADRLSVNVELPTQADLDRVAPGRRLATMQRAMDRIRDGIAESHESRRATLAATAARWGWGRGALPRFAPAGQVTQMVVGATAASDAQLLHASEALYLRQRLRRVYFGSFVPPEAPVGGLTPVAPSPLRERRLYQADWLLRHYGFSAAELAPLDAPDLPLDRDPKLAWALRHPEVFPVDVNRASRELLLRVPGLGRRSIERLLAVRSWHRVRLADLARLRVPVARVLPFLLTADHRPASGAIERLASGGGLGLGTQLELFGGGDRSGGARVLAAGARPHAA